jgi:hypothetical protein
METDQRRVLASPRLDSKWSSKEGEPVTHQVPQYDALPKGKSSQSTFKDLDGFHTARETTWNEYVFK